MEATSYAGLTAARVAKFIISHIIYRYGVPHELISDRGVHFRGEVDTLVQEYGIQHHRSSAYRPQTNEVVECSPFFSDGPKYLYKFIALLPKDYYLIPSNNAMKLVCCVPYLLY